MLAYVFFLSSLLIQIFLFFLFLFKWFPFLINLPYSLFSSLSVYPFGNEHPPAPILLVNTSPSYHTYSTKQNITNTYDYRPAKRIPFKKAFGTAVLLTLLCPDISVLTDGDSAYTLRHLLTTLWASWAVFIFPLPEVNSHRVLPAGKVPPSVSVCRCFSHPHSPVVLLMDSISKGTARSSQHPQNVLSPPGSHGCGGNLLTVWLLFLFHVLLRCDCFPWDVLQLYASAWGHLFSWIGMHCASWVLKLGCLF